MNIVIVWSHWVWKSTVLDSLETDLRKIPEIAREVIEEWNLRPQDMTYQQRVDFEWEMMIRQDKFEIEWDFITDRSYFDILAYSKTFMTIEDYNKLESNIKERIKEKEYRLWAKWWYHYMFYIPVEFPLEDDGVRFNDNWYQNEVDDILREILNDFGIEYIEISWTNDERVAKLMNIIKK